MTHILLVHGHKTHGESSRYLSLSNELEIRGMSVSRFSLKRPVLPDGSHEITSITEELRQVREAIVRLDTRDKLVVVGHSQGGIIVAHLAAAGEIDGGVSLMGVVDPEYHKLRKMDQHGITLDDLHSGKQYLVHYSEGYDVTYTAKWFDDLDNHNVSDLLAHSTCPILFVVGGEDDTVTAEEMRPGFEAAPKPKDWMVIPGLGHVWENTPGKEADIAQAIADWVEKHGL